MRSADEVMFIRDRRSPTHHTLGEIWSIRGAVGEKLQASDPQLRVERPPRWGGLGGPRDCGCTDRAETQREDAAMIGGRRGLSVR